MKRNYSIDMLRIVAMCAVVMIHVYSYFPCLIGSSVARICADLSRWAVPVFIMISGSFLLQREINLKSLWGGQRIFKLLYLLLFWNCVYWLIYPGELPSLYKILIDTNTCHLYFLYVLILLYVLLPILQTIVKSGYGWYYVAIWFLIDVVLSTLNITEQGGLINHIKDDFISMSFGYSGYFVLGYMLYNFRNMFKRYKCVLCIIVCLSMLLYVVVSSTDYVKYLSGGYFNVLITASSISLFALFSNFNTQYSERISLLIKRLSLSSLGVYLIHPLVIEFFRVNGIDELIVSSVVYPSLAIFIILIVVVLISYLLSYLLKRYTLVLPIL